jgi:hypothetical protein
MEEEHQKDREAFERLLRFLPDDEEEEVEGVGVRADSESDEETAEHVEAMLDLARRGRMARARAQTRDFHPSEKSILSQIESIMRDNSDRTWNVRQLVGELSSQGVALVAARPETTVSVALKKLHDRGKITLVAPGTGRKPHTYQWGRNQLMGNGFIVEEEEVIE